MHRINLRQEGMQLPAGNAEPPVSTPPPNNPPSQPQYSAPGPSSGHSPALVYPHPLAPGQLIYPPSGSAAGQVAYPSASAYHVSYAQVQNYGPALGQVPSQAQGSGSQDQHPTAVATHVIPYAAAVPMQPYGYGNRQVVSSQPSGPNYSGLVVVAGGPNSKPPNYMVLSLFSFFCCLWPIGLCAVCFSCRVDSLFYRGDYAGSLQASKLARHFSNASIIFGVLFYIMIALTS
mmetsp:Transcript_1872/g.2565  ORF Transcript_1872/g.2565 Transcript_1872/m.2565 type:complete len:232 (+) Transcript_1872:267-962(+)